MNAGANYSFPDIRKYLRRYGEMRFGKPGTSPAMRQDGNIQDEDFVPHIDLPAGTPEGLSFSFTIDERMKLQLNAPPGLCCDGADVGIYPDCLPNEHGEYKFPLDKTCFIYDRERNFLFGVDPKRLEIWNIPNPKQQRSGASIKVEHLSRTFKNKTGGKSGIENVSFSISPAEFVGIYGGSGTGKTLLVERILSPEYHSLGFVAGKWQSVKGRIWRFFQEKRKGKVLIDDELPEKKVDNIAYLPQSISLPEKLTCREIFELAAADRDVVKKKFTKLVTRVLDWCVLDESILPKTYKSLSGGQRRRVALAVALLREKTSLLIVDEPTTGLDIASESEIMHALRTISRHGITVIAVTHSTASLRLFDRVLILKKTSPRRGSKLAFNGLWHDEALKKFGGMSDPEIFALFTESDDTEAIPPDKVKTIWPFHIDENGESYSRRGNILRNIRRFIFGPTRKLCVQGYHWFAKSALLNIRRKKRLVGFSLLAALCAIIIQLANSGLGYEVKLITLMTLAAPWLCATYAALFVADSTKFFAWEKFSGLRAPSYVWGTFFSMLIPTALISLIFTCGIFWSINPRALSMELLSDCHGIACRSKRVKTKLGSWLGEKNAKILEQKANDYNDTCKEISEYKKLKKQLREIKNAKTTNMEDEKRREESRVDCEKKLGELERSRNVYKNYKFIRSPIYDLWDKIASPFPTSNDFRWDKTISGYHQVSTDSFDIITFLSVWLSMLIICICGVSFGMFMYSGFRDLPVSILAVVVLFIFFLAFSRLMITKQEDLLGPYKLFVSKMPINCQVENLVEVKHFGPYKLFVSKMPMTCDIVDLFNGKAVAILLSFFSLGRYATNSVVYSGLTGIFCGWSLTADKTIILLWTLINVVLAIFGFSNKNRNWKEISR